MFEPSAVWQLFWRCLGLVYVAVFANLAPQALPLRGRRGLAPVAETLRRVSADLPGLRGALYFPTLFWLDSSDAALVLLPWAGMLGGAAIAAFGPSVWALLLCWACFLSWCHSCAEVVPFPWQVLLCETGALALAGCAYGSADGGGGVTMPPAEVEWMLRWLLFRLMFGFGKKKFGPGWWRHTFFIREFFVNNPSPTPFGLWVHGLLSPPAPGAAARLLVPLVCRFLLGGMFVAEMLVPFAYVVPALAPPGSAARAAAGAVTMGLMLGIQLGGNFGHFNLLTAVLALPLFAAAPPPPSAAPLPLGLAVLWWIQAVLGALHLPLDSFTSSPAMSLVSILGALNATGARCRGSVAPPSIARRAALGALEAAVRAVTVIKSFRLVNAYGVFNPESRPPLRQTVVVEGSDDGGVTWREYRTDQAPWAPPAPDGSHADPSAARPAAPPHTQTAPSYFRWTAPWQPLLPYELFYYGMGVPPTTYLYPLSQMFPFSQTRATLLHRLRERLLEPYGGGGWPASAGAAVAAAPSEGGGPVAALVAALERVGRSLLPGPRRRWFPSWHAGALLENNPFPEGPPAQIRVRLVLTSFGTLDFGGSGTAARGSATLHRRHLLTLLPPAGPDPAVWRLWPANHMLPAEAYSLMMPPAVLRARAAVLPEGAAPPPGSADGCACCTAADVERFWAWVGGALGDAAGKQAGKAASVPAAARAEAARQAWRRLPSVASSMGAGRPQLESAFGALTAGLAPIVRGALPSLTVADAEIVCHATLLRGRAFFDRVAALAGALEAAAAAPSSDGGGGGGGEPTELLRCRAELRDPLDALTREVLACPEQGALLRACFWEHATRIGSWFQRASMRRDGNHQFKIVPFIFKQMQAASQQRASAEIAPGVVYFNTLNLLQDSDLDAAFGLEPVTNMPIARISPDTQRWTVNSPGCDEKPKPKQE